MSGGISTGGGTGGGFVQGSNAFGGLNNTDLRPRQRRRRPVPLMDTTWPVMRGRRRGENMRKDLSGLIATLAKSTTGIADQPPETRNELLTKSFGEFEAALLERLDPVLPPDDEPLAKGLNHIATFANALRTASNTVDALKSGKPSWMVNSDSSSPEEAMPEHMCDMLDDWVQVGLDTLRAMVNGAATVAEENDDLRRLEANGNLAKMAMFTGDEVLVKTELPEDYHEFLTDPVDLLANFAQTGMIFTDRARALAEELQKSDSLPDEIVDAFPELFEDPLAKAPPDEELGTGGDADAAPDPGTDANGPPAGPDDDTPQNPVELITRLASIIVVVGGSILQSQGGDMGDTDSSDMTDQGDDPTAGTNAPPTGNPVGAPPPGRSAPPGGSSKVPPQLRRQAPSFDVPLQKILAGEVEVDPSVADALEELIELRKRAPAQNDDLRKQLGDANVELKKLKEMVDRMQSAPAPAKGVTMVVEKRDDTPGPLPAAAGPVDMAKIAADVDRLRETNPEEAARQLLKATHATGGRPFVSFEG